MNTTGLGQSTAASLASSAQHAVSGSFPVRIVRDPDAPETAEDVPDDPKFGVKNVKLFLSTYLGQPSKPNPGTVCKKGRVLVLLTTTKPGPVKFRLWTNVGDKPMQSEFIQAWSSHNGFESKAEVITWVSASKTTKVQAMVEDLTNPIRPTLSDQTRPSSPSLA